MKRNKDRKEERTKKRVIEIHKYSKTKIKKYIQYT